MSALDKLSRTLVGAFGGKKTSPYDTIAEVVRVDGKTAWVHIPGGVDETPVQLTVNAKQGDMVQIRVGGGRAWIVGNATAPPTDDTVAIARTEEVRTVANDAMKTANKAGRIAGNTNQYFWHVQEGEDTGAHITEISSEEFLADPENGGGNTLIRSNGVAIRDGLTELATFGASETQIGATSGKNLKLDSDSIDIRNGSTIKGQFQVNSAGYLQLSAGENERAYLLAGDDSDSGIIGIAATAVPASGNSADVIMRSSKLSGDGYAQAIQLNAKYGNNAATITMQANSGGSSINLSNANRINIDSQPPLKVATQYTSNFTIAASASHAGSFTITSYTNYTPIGIIGFFTNNNGGSGETFGMVNQIYMNDARNTIYYNVRNMASSSVGFRLGVKILYASTKII